MELSRTFQIQQTGWWCGPAATKVALSVLGVEVSQQELADALGTTTDGTNSSNEVVRVLNAYLGGEYYSATFIGGNDATGDEVEALRDVVRNTIPAGYALVANVRGTVTDVDGHNHAYPNGHYVAVTGSDPSNDYVLISDVASGEYWTTLPRLATWIATRGYSSAAVAPVMEAPTAPANSTLYFIDLASPYQDGIDLAAAKAGGIDAVNIKVTEGIGYENPRYLQWATEAKSLGLGISFFHWLDSSGSGEEQANAFISAVMSTGITDYCVMVDCEDDANYNTLVSFISVVKSVTDRDVALYSADWWWVPRGWDGVSLSPYLVAAPNDGYLTDYPGDDSPQWRAGYGGWSELSGLQFAVSPGPGTTKNTSKTRIRAAAWAALTGKTLPTPEEEDMYIIVRSTEGPYYLSNYISRRLIPYDNLEDVRYWLDQAEIKHKTLPDQFNESVLTPVFGPLVSECKAGDGGAVECNYTNCPDIKQAVKDALKEGTE